MVSFMKSASRVVLPKSVAIIIGLSVVLSVVSLGLCAAGLAAGVTSSGWFGLIISAVTVLFHASIALILLIRLRKPISGSYIVEKGLVHIPIYDIEKEVLCTMPVGACQGILFATWVVAACTFLYEHGLRPGATHVTRATIAMMVLEALMMAGLAVRAYVRGRNLAAQAQARKTKRFTTGDLPRPLVLSRNASSVSKASISNPGSPPAVLPEKIKPVGVLCSPTRTPSPPPAAVRPEPRFNGARTLVLVDPRMEASAGTSYHGSVNSR